MHGTQMTGSQSGRYEALADYNTKVVPDKQLQPNMTAFPRQQELSHAIDSCTLGIIREENTINVYFQAHLNLINSNGART